MLIRVGFDIQFQILTPSQALFALSLHPSRDGSVRRPERLQVEGASIVNGFTDPFGNRCGSANFSPGHIRFTNDAVVEDSGLPDAVDWNAPAHPLTELPPECLQFLLSSRYCEVDSELNNLAWSLFATAQPGWPTVQAICDYVHRHLRFDYQRARNTRTAVEAYRERTGVCRDFMHLAITFCRCMNIPARYATGYLGDIGVPAAPYPMDFSAWFEVYLGHRWWTFDARHNERRIGRVLMATGRDAADVALTTLFGQNILTKFHVWTDQVG